MTYRTLLPGGSRDRPRLWQPFEGKPQEEAFVHLADEIFYGGQAGGGKTDLGIGLAVELHQRSLVLRREFDQTKDIVERSREIIGSFGRYNANDKTWRLQDGRRIEFGGMQYERDWQKWKGRGKDLYVFDEVTEFSEVQYRSLIAWNRSVDPDQRCQVLATGNPPTDQDGAWVLDYWGAWLDDDHENPAEPSEIRWYARMDDEDVEVDGPDPITYKGETLYPRSRSVIFASLDDNPVLSATPDYRGVLQSLPEPLKSQLLYGDFQAGLGEDAFALIPRAWLEAAFARWDLKSAPTSGLSVVGCDPNRGGKDDCAICPRYDNWFGKIRTYAGELVDDGPKVAALVIKAMGDRRVPVNIDPIGVGSSPHDSLLANDIDSRPLIASARAVEPGGQKMTDRSGKLTFKSMRDAWHWRLRESLDPELGDDLAIPRDRKLKRELLSIRWKLTVAGIQVSSKDEIKEKVGRSPDRAESLMFANFTDVLVGSWEDVADLTSLDDFESRWA